MFRTVAVILLLLGLATATPVVCLCAPPPALGAFAYARHEMQPANDGRFSRSVDADRGVSLIAWGAPAGLATNGPADDAARLISSSAAAAVASIVATAAGLPSSAPWRLPRPGIVARLRLTMPSAPGGPSWSPAVPPPR